ncbi:hypothetical protein CRG98_021497 [Punica granatum]|uniref:Uncharacterized protein n=1 Tax=Punica granatum TaxID=22663 RepID=A0A2I0JP96_PUNGR|nr:hypothetical protein CRG98_021497 [Punica granatum]
MLSVSKKLVSVSLTWKGGSALGPQLALPWRKGEDRRWFTRKGWHDSPVMRGRHNSPVVRGGWPGWMASSHNTSRRGEVKTMGGLPAKVGITHLSCGVGGRARRPLVVARLAMESMTVPVYVWFQCSTGKTTNYGWGLLIQGYQFLEIEQGSLGASSVAEPTLSVPLLGTSD